MPGPRVLVAYYSVTGTSKAVAAAIVAAFAGLGLKADMEEIIPLRPDRGGIGGFVLYVRAGLTALTGEAWTGQAWAVRPSPNEVGAYDLVIVGGPIWIGRLAVPVRNWLRVHALRTSGRLGTLGKLAVFATSSGSNAVAAFAELAVLAGRVPVARLCVTGRDQQQGRTDQLIAAFAGELKDAMTASASAPQQAPDPARPT